MQLLVWFSSDSNTPVTHYLFLELYEKYLKRMNFIDQYHHISTVMQLHQLLYLNKIVNFIDET